MTRRSLRSEISEKDRIQRSSFQSDEPITDPASANPLKVRRFRRRLPDSKHTDYEISPEWLPKIFKSIAIILTSVTTILSIQRST